jgi:hypothetical protein
MTKQHEGKAWLRNFAELEKDIAAFKRVIKYMDIRYQPQYQHQLRIELAKLKTQFAALLAFVRPEPECNACACQGPESAGNGKLGVKFGLVAAGLKPKTGGQHENNRLSQRKL